MFLTLCDYFISIECDLSNYRLLYLCLSYLRLISVYLSYLYLYLYLFCSYLELIFTDLNFYIPSFYSLCVHFLLLAGRSLTTLSYYCIRMWRYYNTPERLTSLFSKVTEQMIANCKMHIIGDDSTDLLWSNDPQGTYVHTTTI